MLGIFKNLFSQTDNSQITEAVNNGAFLVDVRTPAEFSTGSVKGAVNIPLDKIPGQLAKFKGKKASWCFASAETGAAKPNAFWNKTASNR